MRCWMYVLVLLAFYTLVSFVGDFLEATPALPGTIDSQYASLGRKEKAFTRETTIIAPKT